MSRSKKDLTTKNDPLRGPWAHMRGARGQAEAIQKKTKAPPSFAKTHETAGKLEPGRYDTVRGRRK